MVSNATQIGRSGEYLAAYFFETRGYTAVICGQTSFDLIVAKQSNIHLVEVKSRTTTEKARPNQMHFKFNLGMSEASVFCFVNLPKKKMLFYKKAELLGRKKFIGYNKDWTDENMNKSFAHAFSEISA